MDQKPILGLLLGNSAGVGPELVAMLAKKDYYKEFCRPVIIGERINPTGKKMLQQALRDQDMDYILKEGLREEEAGADTTEQLGTTIEPMISTHHSTEGDVFY